MPNNLPVTTPVSTDQIEQLIQMLNSDGPQAVYTVLASDGYLYAQLAGGVASDNIFAGSEAVGFLELTLAANGVPTTPSLLASIKQNLCSEYLNILLQNSQQTGYAVQDISAADAWAIHIDVFQNLGIPADAWTLNTPFSLISNDAQREAFWESLLTSSSQGFVGTLVSAWDTIGVMFVPETLSSQASAFISWLARAIDASPKGLAGQLIGLLPNPTLDTIANYANLTDTSYTTGLFSLINQAAPTLTTAQAANILSAAQNPLISYFNALGDVALSNLSLVNLCSMDAATLASSATTDPSILWALENGYQYCLTAGSNTPIAYAVNQISALAGGSDGLLNRAAMYLAEMGAASIAGQTQTLYQDLSTGLSASAGVVSSLLNDVVFGSSSSGATLTAMGNNLSTLYAGSTGQTLVGASQGDTNFYALSGDVVSLSDLLGTITIQRPGMADFVLQGGSWSPEQNCYIGASGETYIASTSTSASGTSLVVSLPDGTTVTVVGYESGASGITLSDGPSEYDSNYVAAFNTLDLIAGPAGLGYISAAQINGLLQAQGASYVIQDIASVLGCDSSLGTAALVSAAQQLLSVGASDSWGGASSADRQGELLALLGVASTGDTVDYFDQNGYFWASLLGSSGVAESVVFGGASSNWLMSESADAARLYSGGPGETLMGEGTGTNDYYVLGGDTVIDPYGNGAVHLSSNEAPDQVSFTSSGNNLLIELNGGQDGVVTVENWFSGGPGGIPLSRGVTDGSTTWSAQAITASALTQVSNDLPGQSTTLFGHAGFSDTLIAGAGNDVLSGSSGVWTWANGEGSMSAAPGNQFILGTGIDTVYGGGGIDQIDITAPLATAVIYESNVGSLVQFGSQFAGDTLSASEDNQGNLVITDSEGGSVTLQYAAVNGECPLIETPDGHIWSGQQIAQQVQAARNSRPVYEYDYPQVLSAQDASAMITNLFPTLVTQANSDFDGSIGTSSLVDYYLNWGATNGSFSGNEQPGDAEILSSQFTINDFLPGWYQLNQQSPNDPHEVGWETVSFDTWTDPQSGQQEFAITSLTAGYGGQETSVYDPSTGSFSNIIVPTEQFYSYSQSPTQVLLKPAQTSVTIFGQS